MHPDFLHHAADRCEERDFHFHRLQNHQHITRFDPLTGLHLHLPEVACDMAVDALLAWLQGQLFAAGRSAFVILEVCLAVGDPAFAFSVEGRLLLGSKCCDAVGFAGQEGLVIGQVQGAVFDVQCKAAERKVTADAQQFVGADRVEANLIEETQQPGFAFECGHFAIAVPHLQRAADELITAGAFHAVHAHVSATDADRVLRCPGACRVVLGGHQAMAPVRPAHRGRRRPGP